MESLKFMKENIWIRMFFMFYNTYLSLTLYSSSREETDSVSISSFYYSKSYASYDPSLLLHSSISFSVSYFSS